MNKVKNKKQNLKIGDRFGSLVVVEERIADQIKCFCTEKKEIVTVEVENLINKEKKSSRQKKVRIADMYEQYQQLTVTDNKVKRGKYGQILIQVRCSCGTQKYVKNFDFVNQKIASCGCLKKIRVREAKTTHGLYKSKEYKTWLRLKTICLNENDPSYERYGGIGIEMYPPWVYSFQNFFDDMGPCPEESIITRIDPSKGFFPYNCCWLSRSESKKIQILIECGANPKLFQSKIKSPTSSEKTPSKDKIIAIRKEHAKGESNLSILAKKYNITINEVISILMYSS